MRRVPLAQLLPCSASRGTGESRALVSVLDQNCQVLNANGGNVLCVFLNGIGVRSFIVSGGMAPQLIIVTGRSEPPRCSDGARRGRSGCLASR
jgi:hypothetical protein